MLEWETENVGSVQAVLDGFRSVWERVEGTQATDLSPDHSASRTNGPDRDAEPSCEERLRERIKAAEASAMYDRALACRCRGTSRTMLQDHAAQAAHRAACLRGELFVRYGVRHDAPESCPRLGDTLTALREGMLCDESAAEAYRRDAGQSDSEELRKTLERFACEAAAAAAEKRRMILRCFQ